MKKLLLLFALMLALLAPVAHSYFLEVKVTVTQDTPAVGTNISLISEGVELSMLKANISGAARFNVTRGSYFVLLRRYPYPLHIALVEVQNDTSVLLTMRQLVSYSTAYGQITGPVDFANASVAAYQGGLVQKRVSANRDGLYVLSFLPEGTYDLVFSAPGFANYTASSFLPVADSVQVNAALKKPVEAPAQKPVLAAPVQVSQFSSIEISLTLGGQPIAGAEIQAETPSGSVILRTDQHGKALLNAAEGGAYRFSYGNATAETTVPMPPKPAEPPAPPPVEQQPVQPLPQPVEQPQPSAVPVLLLVAFGLVVAVAIAAVLFIAFRSRKPPHQKHGHKEEAEQEAQHDKGHHHKKK